MPSTGSNSVGARLARSSAGSSAAGAGAAPVDRAVARLHAARQRQRRRAAPARGTRHSSMRTPRSGSDASARSWRCRPSCCPACAGSRCPRRAPAATRAWCRCASATFTTVVSSKLRQRPPGARSGVPAPGWAAEGQRGGGKLPRSSAGCVGQESIHWLNLLVEGRSRWPYSAVALSTCIVGLFRRCVAAATAAPAGAAPSFRCRWRRSALRRHRTGPTRSTP